MRKNFLLLPIIGVFAYLTLCSDKNGKGSNYTSSPGSIGSGCGSCHGNADTTVHVTFELDSLGVPVTKYKAGMVYVLKIKGLNNSSAATLPKFGFQMVTLKGTSSTQAGSWSTVPSGASTHTTAGISVIEHNTPNAALTGGGGLGTKYEVVCGWTAPASGTGTVSVYGALNAVNGNNSDDNGDNWNLGSATFGEWTPSSVENTTANNITVNAYPNPVTSVLNLELDGNKSGTATITVFDINGRVVVSQDAATERITLNTSNWQSGLYMVNITKDGATKAISVVKQ